MEDFNWVTSNQSKKKNVVMICYNQTLQPKSWEKNVSIMKCIIKIEFRKNEGQT